MVKRLLDAEDDTFELKKTLPAIRENLTYVRGATLKLPGSAADFEQTNTSRAANAIVLTRISRRGVLDAPISQSARPNLTEGIVFVTGVCSRTRLGMTVAVFARSIAEVFDTSRLRLSARFAALLVKI
jgi:hypothetical protein